MKRVAAIVVTLLLASCAKEVPIPVPIHIAPPKAPRECNEVIARVRLPVQNLGVSDWESVWVSAEKRRLKVDRMRIICGAYTRAVGGFAK